MPSTHTDNTRSHTRYAYPPCDQYRLTHMQKACAVFSHSTLSDSHTCLYTPVHNADVFTQHKNHMNAAHTLMDVPSFANSTQSRACLHNHMDTVLVLMHRTACTLSCTHIVPTIQHSYLWVHDTNTHTASHNSPHTHAHSMSTHVCTTHIHTLCSCVHLSSTHTLTYTSHTLMCAHAAHRAAGWSSWRNSSGVRRPEVLAWC